MRSKKRKARILTGIACAFALFLGGGTLYTAAAEDAAEPFVVGEGISRFEVEDAALTDCNVRTETQLPGISGSGYVAEYTSSSMSFNLDVEEAGVYRLTIRHYTTYVNAALLVTAGEAGRYYIDCTTRSEWTDAKTEIALQAGTQLVSVKRGNGTVVVDYIELEKIGEYVQPAISAPVRYEAEDATLTGGTIVQTGTTGGNASGDSLARLDAAGKGVDFSVKVPSAGVYYLSIGYFTTFGGSGATNAKVDVAVSNGTSNRVDMSVRGTTSGTYAWHFSSEMMEVFLPAGTQTISVSRALQITLLDYIELEQKSEFYAAEMTAGASVRLKADAENSGLRFESVYEKSTVDALAEETERGRSVESVFYGTLIVPADYLADGTALTFEALEAAEKAFLDVPSTGFATEGTDTYGYYGSIVDIYEQNYTRDFVGIGYIKIETADGRTEYLYAEYDENNVRSVSEVAERALADVSQTADENYRYPVGDGSYSPYSESQRFILAGYVSAGNVSENKA